ncbi:MAG: hypothetical protein JW731_03665 [Bacteroidales bacterium]|nr:hypothetical protein [Bacteroidales bacterium]
MKLVGMLWLAVLMAAVIGLQAQTGPRCCVTSFVTPDDSTNPAQLIDTVFPSGNGSLYGQFNVTAEFSNTEPCLCRCCEYRQEVKGEFWYDGNKIDIDLVDPSDTTKRKRMSKDSYGEDYRDYKGNKVRYGHRGESRSADEKYTTDGTTVDRQNGCRYWMNDEPGWKSTRRGHSYKIDLKFRGSIVSTCEGGCDNCGQKEWAVKLEKTF